MEKSPEELFKERKKRIEEAIQLKVPDRVPVISHYGYFPAKYAGMTVAETFYDYRKLRKAYLKTLLDFPGDMVRLSSMGSSGPVLEALDARQIKWPGHGVSPNHGHQFVEGEYMKEDEYDAFLDDPSDFAIRTYAPRIFGNLEGLKKLPPFRMMMGTGAPNLAAALVSPEFADAVKALAEAGQRELEWRSGMADFAKEPEKLGFPIYTGSMGIAPFDTISDNFRGMRGSMLDMFRRPEKLLEACERILQWNIKGSVAMAKASGNPRVFIPLHRGSDGFMSPKQFETFYWPTFKGFIVALVDEGLTPCPFFEGDYTSRLEYLLELPKGKVLGHFDATDLFKAKEVLKDHMCIMGNVPSSLLCTGTPRNVQDYCKKLIDVVGKGGGYILSSGCAWDDARPENARAMLDFTKEYGVYK